MNRSFTCLAAGVLAALGVGMRDGDETPARAAAVATDTAEATIAETLDSFHRAAADADEERYFAHFAPNGVFLGTDPAERWTLAEFRAWAKPHFENGKGWTYHAIERHIDISPSGECGWFDEVVRNVTYGDLRGTGVVLLIDGEWKIAQYNLTFLIPNEDAAEVLKLIDHEH